MKQPVRSKSDEPSAPGQDDKELAAAAERARLRVDVAKQNVRLAKGGLKRARKRFKEAKREVRRARKRADAARKVWKQALRKVRKSPPTRPPEASAGRKAKNAKSAKTAAARAGNVKPRKAVTSKTAKRAKSAPSAKQVRAARSTRRRKSGRLSATSTATARRAGTKRAHVQRPSLPATQERAAAAGPTANRKPHGALQPQTVTAAKPVASTADAMSTEGTPAADSAAPSELEAHSS